MSVLFLILIFSLLGSIFSLVGGVLLLWKEKWARGISMGFVSFAAGALLGAAFLELLPDSLEKFDSPTQPLIFALTGIIIFFLVEKLLVWYHCHDGKCLPLHPFLGGQGPVSFPKYMILVGDAIHNFIDGIIITVSFLVSIPTGIIASLAVVLHEIPQEIGDFGVLLHGGVKRAKILLLNFIAAIFTLVGAMLSYLFLRDFLGILPSFLAFAAGGFIYIATADLIPEIHREIKWQKIFLQTFLFLLGIVMIWWIGMVME